MEEKKLDKKIREWATALGFTLPDGSAPPPNYFALLTATPHRRQLWEFLIESVQPRKEVQQKRKQILAARLKHGRRNLTHHDGRQVNDRIELWMKQDSLETEINEKRKSVVELEKNILLKAREVMLEICKLSELEKQCEEYKEKSLVIHLFTKKQGKLIEKIEKLLLKVTGTLNREHLLENYGQPMLKSKLEKLKDDICNTEACDGKGESCLDCNIQNKIKEYSDSGVSEECLWEEVVKCKQEILEKFSEFLEDLDTKENSVISEKERDIQKALNSSVTRLKQSITEKSLNVLLNDAEGKLLNSEIDTLIEHLEKLIFEGCEDASLNENISFLTPEELNESFAKKEESFSKIKNHMNLVGVNAYQEYLKEEIKRVENESERQREQHTRENDVEKELEETVKSIKSIYDETIALRSEEEEQGRKILESHEKMENLRKGIVEEMREEGYVKEIEEIVSKVKTGLDRQIDLFADLPLDAFRMIQTPSGRKSFECESLSHCFNNYGGEFKQFFSAMLISPNQGVDSILEVIRTRKELVEVLNKFIDGRKALAESQKKTFTELSSIKYDSQFCEKNFNDSYGIIWSILHKADGLKNTIDLAERILRNWTEQPYRSMISETEKVNGMTLKEYEEKFRKLGIK